MSRALRLVVARHLAPARHQASRSRYGASPRTSRPPPRQRARRRLHPGRGPARARVRRARVTEHRAEAVEPRTALEWFAVAAPPNFLKRKPGRRRRNGGDVVSGPRSNSHASPVQRRPPCAARRAGKSSDRGSSKRPALLWPAAIEWCIVNFVRSPFRVRRSSQSGDTAAVDTAFEQRFVAGGDRRHEPRHGREPPIPARDLSHCIRTRTWIRWRRERGARRPPSASITRVR